MKYLYYFLYSIFLLFATVQYNDPDSLHWIMAYLFVAFALFLRQKRKITDYSLLLIAIPYILWAIDLFPQQWEGILLNETGMKTLNIELGRESLGLGLSAIILLLFYLIDKD